MAPALDGLRIRPATPEDAAQVAALVGALLHEIMAATGSADFHFDLADAEARAADFLRRGAYHALLACRGEEAIGVACLCECRALYAEGDFGALAELYVRPAWRSQGVGGLLMEQVKALGQARGWRRLEATTPPLPPFEPTLAFYQRQGFSFAGGRKLKLLL